MFYLSCPMCGKPLGRSENGRSEITCTKCKAKMRYSVIPGLLYVWFDSKQLRSAEYDGDPAHDRRVRDFPGALEEF